MIVFLLSFAETFHFKNILNVIHSQIVNGLENVKQKTVFFLQVVVVRMFVTCLLPIAIEEKQTEYVHCIS